MELIDRVDGFDLVLGGRLLLSHRAAAPCFFVGRGDPSIHTQRGHFQIEDSVSERVALRHAAVSRSGDVLRIFLAPSQRAEALLELTLESVGADATLGCTALDSALNRFWLRLVAEPDEHLWGGGEQFSYFNLRGRRFPLWVSEPGVGRDKSSQLTWQCDRRNGGGGDYYTTNYPQPTYLSSRRYALHVETTAYAVFDFRRPEHHEIEIWEVPKRMELWQRDRFTDLVGVLSERFGRQPQLPDWLLKGAIIGLKEGAASFDRLETYIESGAALSGLWCEDWVGIRQTAFGRRLFWDWRWQPERYPGLDAKIGQLEARGLRFLGYVNPYLSIDGTLYPEAKAAGYLVRRTDSDEPYLLDFGEFECGLVDFTNPAASAWFSEAVIGRNMLDFGLSGWMADFGEYLPTDIRLHDGSDAKLTHNAWPVLWGEVNARAVAERGKTGEAIFFMRSGYSGVQRHCPLLWAGDQSVDFSRHDGIATVLCAALSSGLLGNAYHHSDIGGYTSLFGTVRTPELVMRWAELAAFTAVMRSHEGNRPDDNTQIDKDPAVLAHFARMTRIYAHLSPCLRALSAEAAATGLPVQRPLFLHFQDDPKTYAIQTSFLYGSDLLVAPVLAAGVSELAIYLPAGADWIEIWTGARHEGGAEVTVAAPLGKPPLFYRPESAQAALFAGIAAVE